MAKEAGMSRAVIFEIVGVAMFAILSGVVGTVYLDIQMGKKERLENKEAIEMANKVGEGEIRRSSDVDIAQKDEIAYNKQTIKELKSDFREMYREVGEVKRDVYHAHEAKK